MRRGKMAKKDFEIIDHTADTAVIAYGADLKQLFSNAALALFSLVTDPKSIRQELQRDVKIISEDRDTLLVEWLNELIYLFDAEHILFSRFDIEKLTNDCLKASCYGENVDPLRHGIRMGVKAATYHMLKIDKDSNGYKVQIIFDI
jgi:SHS2 domain-containing protein